MKSFTRLFLSVFAALTLGGVILYYLSLPFSSATSAELDLVRIRLARYLGSVGGLYVVITAFAAMFSASLAGAVGGAISAPRVLRRVFSRAVVLSVLVTILGAVCGLGLVGMTHGARRLVSIEAVSVGSEAVVVDDLSHVTPRRVLSRRITGYLGEQQRPAARTDAVDPVVLLILFVLAAVTVGATRFGGALRRLSLDSHDALGGLVRIMDAHIAPVAIFLVITSWLLVVWPAAFSWYLVLVGVVLLIGLVIVGLLSGVAGSHGDVTIGYFLRALRLAQITAFGLGSPLLTIPQVMACGEENLAFDPEQRNVAVPTAICLARPGTALVLAFGGAYALSSLAGIGPWSALGVVLAATILALVGIEVSGGIVLGVVAASSWAGVCSSEAAIVLAPLTGVILVAVRVACATDVTAAAAVALRCGSARLPEGLDPDLPDEELLRMARRRRGSGSDGGKGKRRPRPTGGRTDHGTKSSDAQSDGRSDGRRRRRPRKPKRDPSDGEQGRDVRKTSRRPARGGSEEENPEVRPE